jgi:anthranilate phosphoribosyltransferase
MQAIGYRRAMVVHGFDGRRETGMDELSTIGESVVHEFHPDGREDRYTLAPEDVGIRRAGYAEIATTGDIRQEAGRFFKVLAGSAPAACIDITCLNAAAVLYIAGKAADLKSGIAQSRELIHSGRALEKLCHWATVQKDENASSVKRFLDQAAGCGRENPAFS